MGRVAARARRIIGEISWYWQSLMGDNHYQRYLEHRARMHAGQAVMSEREYWRHRHDTTDTGARCC